MNDCFNFSCPAYEAQCPCVACPNRTLSEFTITSNRTLTQQEIRDAQAIVMGCKQEPPKDALLNALRWFWAKTVEEVEPKEET